MTLDSDFQDRERVGNADDGRSGRHVHLLPVIRRGLYTITGDQAALRVRHSG